MSFSYSGSASQPVILLNYQVPGLSTCGSRYIQALSVKIRAPRACSLTDLWYNSISARSTKDAA
jgi:hypothetical protein